MLKPTRIIPTGRKWPNCAQPKKGDNYVVQIHRSLDEPLRSLVIAAALAVDTALKQGQEGRRH
jgi:hypothetical protein